MMRSNNERGPSGREWEDLKAWFFRLCLSKECPWQSNWHLLASHPWFERQLESSVAHVTRSNMPPGFNRDDLRQESLLLFGEKLSRDRSLKIDWARADNTFGAWLGKITNRVSAEAMRRLSRQCRKAREEAELARKAQAERDMWRQAGLCEDMIEALAQYVDDEQRRAALLAYSGYSAERIAEILERTDALARPASHPFRNRLRLGD